MYYEFLVEIPDLSGKISCVKSGKNTYIKYEYDKVYDHARKTKISKRIAIGKVSKTDQGKMQPNQNFWIYFPGTEIV